MRIARVIGHVGWWVFVLGAVFTRFVQPIGFGPRRYADYLSTEDHGWTAYLPLTDDVFDDRFAEANIFATVTLVAAVVVLLAAITEAVLGRRLVTGLLTIAAPLVGGALVFLVARGGIDSAQLRPVILFALALLGVAIREVWSRALAPTRELPQSAESRGSEGKYPSDPSNSDDCGN